VTFRRPALVNLAVTVNLWILMQGIEAVFLSLVCDVTTRT